MEATTAYTGQMGVEQSLDDVRFRLARSRAVTVLTGSGISADSGIPTFRGTDGLWNTFRAEDLATPEAFARDPYLVWKWYNWRRELIAGKQPNAAHDALVELERRLESRAGRFHLITQNVDGLHRAAGSRRMTEIHGSIWRVRCTGCGALSDNREVPIQIPPMCIQCRAMLRPDIVWFGEALAEEDLRTSYEASESCEILLIIGTSGLVYPAASFAPVAKAAGAYVVELNLEITPSTEVVDCAFQGRAKNLVPALLEQR
ncbi:MAG TPA: NAD-dependent deacylase [Nitrospiraceae bacterium]|jgi:NAD-dependent deacetylase|nr:NAD-dependent deacylase [Nitrospiraceae bacterium]